MSWGGMPWVRSMTRLSRDTRAMTPWHVPTNSSSSPKSEMKTIGRPGTDVWRPLRGLYFWRRSQRVRFRSFLCFFLRIFLRRFLTTEGKAVPFRVRGCSRAVRHAGRESLVGSEEVSQIDPADPEVLLQSHGPELQGLRGLA